LLDKPINPDFEPISLSIDVQHQPKEPKLLKKKTGFSNVLKSFPLTNLSFPLTIRLEKDKFY